MSQDTQDHGTQQAKQGFRPVHLVLILVILGALGAIAIPNFVNFRLKAKTSEQKSNLGAIRGGEVAYVAEWGFYVGNAPLTPRIRPKSSAVSGESPFQSTRFSIIGFAPTFTWCSYALAPPNWPTEDEGFTAWAECDYDNDGDVAIHTITSRSLDITHSGAPF